MNKKYYIGCSGYYYPNWKNKFYPQGLQPRNWLAYYSSQFNTIELNGTFYRMPKLADLQRYAAATGPEFMFSVKASRYLTHVLKLQQAKENVDKFIGLMREGLGDKLACILFQMPPSFQYTREHLDHLIATIPHNERSVVEFRHPSWWNPESELAFRQAGITFCNMDYPGLEVPLIRTSGLFYFRLHGNPVLFKSAYSVEQLTSFYKRFPDTEHNYIYFNNTYHEAGYTNARELQQIISADTDR